MKNVSITSAGKHLRLQCPVARVEKGKVKGPVSRSDSHDILSDSLRSRTIWRSAAAEFRDELEIQGVNIPRQTSRFSLTRNDVFFSNKLSALHLRGKASDTDMFTIKMFDSCSKENEMSSHSVFKGCDDTVKARLEAYWAKKLPRLQKLLVPYRTDLQEIRLTVYHHQQNPQRSWYETRAVIHLPTGTLVAEANDKDP